MLGGFIPFAVLLAGLGAAPPSGKGPAAAGTRVFASMVDDTGALPVACFHPGSGWRSGRECVRWLPSEGPLRTLAGGEGRLLRLDPRVRCSGYDRGRSGLRVQVPTQSGAVLWPSTPPSRFEWPGASPEPAPLPREALAELYRFAEARMEARPGTLGLTLDSTYALDVDGNGTKDLLVVADALACRVTQAQVAAAVLMGPVPRTVPLGFSPAGGGLNLAGVMDLDADGVPELWLQVDTLAATTSRLVRLRGDRFEELGRLECPMASPEELAALPKGAPKAESCGPGEDPAPRLQAQVRTLPLPTAEQRATRPHPDREAELLALTVSPGFLAVPSEVSRISQDLAAIRAMEPSLSDVHYLAPHDGQHLTLFFVDPSAALQGVYPPWDSLNEAFGVKAVKPGGYGGVELEFGPVLDLTRVAARYRGLPGVTEASTPGVIDGSTVRVCRKGEVAWYTFDIGSDDCPSGCMRREWHVFRVARPGARPESLGTGVPGARPEPEWLRQFHGDCRDSGGS